MGLRKSKYGVAGMKPDISPNDRIKVAHAHHRRTAPGRKFLESNKNFPPDPDSLVWWDELPPDPCIVWW